MKLFVDPLDIGAHGAEADAEFGRDLFVRLAARQSVKHLEFPRGGDPAWDLAYWDHHNRHRESLGWILDGYDDDAVRARIRPWSVAISLGYVVQHVPQGTLGPGFYDWVYDHLVAGLSSS